MNKWSFRHFIKHKEIWPDKENIEEVHSIIKDNAVNAELIALLRDKEIAHHDFDARRVIRHDLNKLENLKDMEFDAVTIINLLSNAYDAEFDFHHDYSFLNALKELVNHQF